LADLETEKFLKRLVGRTDVEVALHRLDILTKEEALMTATRCLEVTHHVDGNVAMIKELTHDVRDNVRVVEDVTRRVDANVKSTKDGMKSLLYVHTRTDIFCFLNQQWTS
jgi:hypothetical protein